MSNPVTYLLRGGSRITFLTLAQWLALPAAKEAQK